MVSNYRFTHRFSVSVNATYSTGRPITLPIGVYSYAGSLRALYSDRNAYRIPDYFRTDFSMNIDGNHKSIRRRTIPGPSGSITSPAGITLIPYTIFQKMGSSMATSFRSSGARSRSSIIISDSIDLCQNLSTYSLPCSSCSCPSGVARTNILVRMRRPPPATQSWKATFPAMPGRHSPQAGAYLARQRHVACGNPCPGAGGR